MALSRPILFARNDPPASPTGRDSADSLILTLLRDGVLSGDQMAEALALRSRRRGRLEDILLATSSVARDDLYTGLARHWGTSTLDPATVAVDARLIDRIGAATCLRHHLLPLAGTGATVVVATSSPAEFQGLRPWLTSLLGPVSMAIAEREGVEARLIALRGAELVGQAETRVPAMESCRSLPGARLLLPAGLAAVAALVLMLVWPALLLWLAASLAVVTLILSTGLKLAAVFSAGPARLDPATHPPATAPPLPSAPLHAPIMARLPIVSIMVALYREADIAPRLVRRLGRLDYPPELLDVLLIVEEDDHLTRAALARADLPPWFRVITVPKGVIKTKPRALNFALDRCRGAIIGVYDAEDAPDPDQIRKVVERFHARGPDVACLQGVLDFYNPRSNWLARCFTVEYASWFRLILPGLERLRLPLPLGGTTVFFRRKVLEDIGAWDAHNVTEDADLGLRLARHGFRTEMIDTVTYEEANCHAFPWVKQRSRWIKGYMVTWATHMRAPRQLWRDLGPRGFIGMQILFFCSLSQFLLMPVLWSFWLAAMGFPHPVVDALPAPVFTGLVTLFLMTEATNIVIGCHALTQTSHRLSRFWVPTLHFYFPLAALASYKALWEVLWRPFYWDKTSHGEFDHDTP